VIAASTPAATAMPEPLRTAVQDVLTRTPKRLAKQPSDPAETDPRAVAERAKLTAAVVLDVLAGNRSPNDAATALGLSVARYYVIEEQAIDGLIAGCGPRQRGRQPDPGKELARLTAENQRLAQALLRQQALVRTSQRSLGVALPTKPAATTTTSPGRGKGKRQPKVRALRAVKRLKATTTGVATAAVSTTTPPASTTSSDGGGG
jgi:hypothetical protein